MINRTRRRDIGEFTTRKPETVTVEFTRRQRRLHDDLLDVVARILAVLPRPAEREVHDDDDPPAGGELPLRAGAAARRTCSSGKLDRLELMEASDSDEEVDLGFVDEVRGDIEGLLDAGAAARSARTRRSRRSSRCSRTRAGCANNKALVFSTFRHTLAYLATHTAEHRAARRPRPRRRAGRGARRSAPPVRAAEGGPRRDRRPAVVGGRLRGSRLPVLRPAGQLRPAVESDADRAAHRPHRPLRAEERDGRDRQPHHAGHGRCRHLRALPVRGSACSSTRSAAARRSSARSPQDLHDIAESFTLTAESGEERLQQLADNCIRQIREEQELESKQAELFGLNVPGQHWREEIEAAESFWLSPDALQGSVRAYLAGRLGSDSRAPPRRQAAQDAAAQPGGAARAARGLQAAAALARADRPAVGEVAQGRTADARRHVRPGDGGRELPSRSPVRPAPAGEAGGAVPGGGRAVRVSLTVRASELPPACIRSRCTAGAKSVCAQTRRWCRSARMRVSRLHC